MELTEEILNQEFNDWTKTNGSGRDKQDQRFGQYLWNKYELDGLFAINDAAINGFGAEKAENAYTKIMGAINEK